MHVFPPDIRVWVAEMQVAELHSYHGVWKLSAPVLPVFCRQLQEALQL